MTATQVVVTGVIRKTITQLLLCSVLDMVFTMFFVVQRCTPVVEELTLWLTGNNGGYSSSCHRNGPPGSGGVSAQVYGGGCCCSSEGAHGLIRVTLFLQILITGSNGKS